MNPGFFQEDVTLVGLEGQPFFQQLQIILCSDLVYFGNHIYGIATVGIFILIGDFCVIRIIVHQLTIRVIGFQKCKPLSRSFLNIITAVAKQSQNVPSSLDWLFQILSIVIKGLGIGFRTNGHILQPQHVDHSTSNQH